MEYVDYVFEKLQRKGMDDIAVERIESSISQVRYSDNSKDLYNDWSEDTISVFAAKGKKIGVINIKDYSSMDKRIDELVDICNRVPENPSYFGINPKKQCYPKPRKFKIEDRDVQEIASMMISSAQDEGAERTAGVVYRNKFSHNVKTNYNEYSFETGGHELLIRAFCGASTGQESLHYGIEKSIKSSDPEEMGRTAARTAKLGSNGKQGSDGKFTVLMSPYLLGNIISYSSGFLSSYSVDAGMSCFIDKIGEKVADDSFTLYDDPTDYSGEGARPIDEEGTVTKKNTLIEKGTLKSYLHSFSTGQKFSSETTANAGIIAPRAWQMKVEPGKDSFESMLSDIKDGLFINNSWYTRFQDYRNGVFSTVPRDGIFRIKNGEIMETWTGIRISESVLNVLQNVRSLSKETKNVKWWEEIFPSVMPYALVENVNITKAF